MSLWLFCKKRRCGAVKFLGSVTLRPVTAAQQHLEANSRVALYRLARGSERHQHVLFTMDDQRGHRQFVDAVDVTGADAVGQHVGALDIQEGLAGIGIVDAWKTASTSSSVIDSLHARMWLNIQQR